MTRLFLIFGLLCRFVSADPSGLFAGLRIILWDSHSSLTQKNAKFLNPFLDTLAFLRGNPLGLLMPLPHPGRI